MAELTWWEALKTVVTNPLDTADALNQKDGIPIGGNADFWSGLWNGTGNLSQSQIDALIQDGRRQVRNAGGSIAAEARVTADIEHYFELIGNVTPSDAAADLAGLAPSKWTMLIVAVVVILVLLVVLAVLKEL